MKKYINILFVLCCSIFLLIHPFHVKAEESYTVLGICTNMAKLSSGSIYAFGVSNNFSEVRGIFINRNANESQFIAISLNSFIFEYGWNGACGTKNKNSQYTTIYGNNVYIARSVLFNFRVTTGYCPVYEYSEYSSEFTMDQLAYYMTFGDGSINVRQWGELANVGYKTKIIGSGKASLNNKDVITWNPTYDILGNEFTEDCKVDIRIVPGSYAALDKESLLQKTYHDFIKDITHSAVLTQLPVSQGEYSLTWNQAINYLNRAYPFKDSSILSIFTQGGSWVKNGWIYQYRLVADGYQGEWKDIYTLTSSGVKNDLKVVNIVNIDNDVINVINDITEIDVDVDVVIIYEDVIIPYVPSIPTPEPSTTPEPVIPDSDNIPWWVYLLNAILDLIRSISEGIASIITSIINAVSDIINGIMDLFKIDNFQIPDIELHMHEIGNNNILGFPGLVVDGLPGIMSSLPTTSFIIHFPGIKLMNVQLIEEMYIDLESYLTALGISHEFMYTCTDGTVYTCIAWLLGRKIIWWLRR